MKTRKVKVKLKLDVKSCVPLVTTFFFDSHTCLIKTMGAYLKKKQVKVKKAGSESEKPCLALIMAFY